MLRSRASAAEGASAVPHSATLTEENLPAIPSNGDLFNFPEIANTLDIPRGLVADNYINNTQPAPVIPGPHTGGTASTSLPSESAPRLDVTDYLDPPLPPIGLDPQFGVPHLPEPLSAPPPAISPSDGPGELEYISKRWLLIYSRAGIHQSRRVGKPGQSLSYPSEPHFRIFGSTM
jgi:hypothetical protein